MSFCKLLIVVPFGSTPGEFNIPISFSASTLMSFDLVTISSRRALLKVVMLSGFFKNLNNLSLLVLITSFDSALANV